ncbi:hypothetical protein LQG66_28600 [Bradyrhizobium ontarionense]|uniref:Abortive infection protein-like C-terminal domain-containing protein n=1 Tax=Bradyrhizobium ontarionense TaxID=2898149 RepID=A0ABY3R7L9_9BRAD|nr:hypothetical protein [Bradyrhizobium sp. A19]UFZ03169.1 hypothetical protein LQG66_28600 [Bradyrhizobium sp. A19]
MPRVVPSEIIALIDQHYSAFNARTLDITHATVAGLMAIARLVDELPTELLTISGADYSDLVSGVEAIKNSVGFWQRKGAGQIGVSEIRGRNVLSLIRDALAKCPDQSPSPVTADLAFISDADLRDSIRLDLSTATSALHNGEWKAATVLAGSAAEALLLWAIGPTPDLTNVPVKTKGPPDEWALGVYIAVADSLGLIKRPTAQQITLAKDFRNLIHPGRAQRLGETCDKGAALTALAAVELIVRDLSN